MSKVQTTARNKTHQILFVLQTPSLFITHLPAVSYFARAKLTATDYGVAEHHTLATILEDMATTDQLDIANLLGAERLVRKMQMIEYFWEEKQREQDAQQQRMPTEEVNAFTGGVGAAARPSSTICPTMMDHISKELERVGNIKKNARKLREETKAPPQD